MESDVKLNGDRIEIDCRVVQAAATDLILDNPGRHTVSPSSSQRRALVHDFKDGLTINWAKDYPGGVTILGDAHVSKLKDLERVDGADKIRFETRVMDTRATDLVLDNQGRRKPGKKRGGQRRALVHDFDDGLTINWNSDYPGGITMRGAVRVPESLSIDVDGTQVDLASALKELRAEVDDLKAKVAALGG